MSTPALLEKRHRHILPSCLTRLPQKIHYKHYSRRTELSYLHRIKRYILFHGKRHPKEVGAAEIDAFPPR